MSIGAFPHTFIDGAGNIASGAEVMDNLNLLRNYLNGNIEASAIVDLQTKGEWTAMPWTVTMDGGITPGAKYYKDALGIVHIDNGKFGFNTTQTAGAVLGTMPAGYRPAVKTYFYVTRTGGDGYVLLFSIDTNGTINNEGGMGSFSGSTAAASGYDFNFVGGCTYRADN